MTPPDSGEREARKHATWCRSYYFDPVRGELYPCNCVEPPPSASLPLPLSLAQRILAALEEEADAYDADDPQAQRLYALESELRERMPK